MCIHRKDKKALRVTAAGLLFFLIFSLVLPVDSLAARSGAGGGDVSSFDIGDFAATLGMYMAAYGVTKALGSAWEAGKNAVSGASAAGNSAAAAAGTQGTAGIPTIAAAEQGTAAIPSIATAWDLNPSSYWYVPGGTWWTTTAPSDISSLAINNEVYMAAVANTYGKAGFFTKEMVKGYSAFAAASQVGRSAVAAGNYYHWKPSTVYLLSNIASSAAGGLLNPSVSLGKTLGKASETALSTMGKGAAVGAITGLARGGVVVAIDGDKMDNRDLPSDERRPGALAQIAGLAAGFAAGNFARTLVSYATYSEKAPGSYKRVPNSEIKNLRNLADKANQANDTKTAGEYLAEAARLQESHPYVYKEVLKTHPFTGKPEELGEKEYYDSHLKEMFGGDVGNIRSERWGDFYKLTQINTDIGAGQVLQRLFNAAFIETGNIWPSVASGALSTLAVESLNRNGDREKISLIVNSFVEGIAGRVFSGLAELYALKPGLYLGENHISDSIEYIDKVFKVALETKLDNLVGDKLLPIYRNYKDKLVDTAAPEYQKYKADYKQELEKAVRDSGLDIGTNDLMGLINAVRAELKRKVEKGEITDAAVQSKYDDLDKAVSKLKEGSYDPLYHMKMVRTSAGHLLQEQIKDGRYNENKDLGQIFKEAGSSRLSLITESALKDIKFNLLEGGVSYLVDKLAGNRQSVGAGCIYYGAAMLTAAIRGALWNSEWENIRNKDKDLIWMPRFSIYEPVLSTEGDWIEQGAAREGYIKELQKFYEFGILSGLKLRPRERMIAGKDKPEIILGYELEFKDDRPDQRAAVLTSLLQANKELLNNALVFYYPQARPENITVPAMVNYFDYLNGYAMSGQNPGWLSNSLKWRFATAGSSVTVSNIMTSAAAYKPISNLFDIRRQRFVLTDGIFNGINPNPYTVQTLDYKPWALGLQTRFYIPFPNTNLNAQSTSNENLIDN